MITSKSEYNDEFLFEVARRTLNRLTIKKPTAEQEDAIVAEVIRILEGQHVPIPNLPQRVRLNVHIIISAANSKAHRAKLPLPIQKLFLAHEKWKQEKPKTKKVRKIDHVNIKVEAGSIESIVNYLSNPENQTYDLYAYVSNMRRIAKGYEPFVHHKGAKLLAYFKTTQGRKKILEAVAVRDGLSPDPYNGNRARKPPIQKGQSRISISAKIPHLQRPMTEKLQLPKRLRKRSKS